MATKRSDRCDADCPAAAQVQLINVHLHTLQFCGHHLNRFAEALDAQGFNTTAKRDDDPTVTTTLEPA